MVDFKRLSQVSNAARESVAEELKHCDMDEGEKRVAQQFFLKGTIWERKQTFWTPEAEEAIRKRLISEYTQANNMIDYASRADRPINGGLIKEQESAASLIKDIKEILVKTNSESSTPASVVITPET